MVVDLADLGLLPRHPQSLLPAVPAPPVRKLATVPPVELYHQLAILQARESFWAFRQFLDPKLKKGWWQRDIANHLQQFRDDLFAQLSPSLVIMAPPQHGKSVQVIDFIAWICGQAPHLKTIFTSVSERLGVRANLRLRRIFASKRFNEVFPDFKLATANNNLLEMVGADGYFRNTTVRGAIVGESLDFGVIDDPLKGREEANSEVIRDKTWDWFTDDFFSRFSEFAGMLIVLTRWHIDDPVGRLVAQDPSIKVLRYPAVAEVDEKYRKAGEVLFPEHKSLDFLLKRKAVMAPENWEALYQQNPVIAGGNLFKDEWFLRHTEVPKLAWRAIYIDTAQKTKERNDFTVMQEWGKGVDGKAYLLDQVRARFEAPELLTTALTFWEKAKSRDAGHYGFLRKMQIEDKVSGTGLIQQVRRKSIPVLEVQRNTDKYTRALDVVPFASTGLVSIPKDAVWLKSWIGEVIAFPDGTNDDQVDPMIDALLDMCSKGAMYSAEALA